MPSDVAVIIVNYGTAEMAIAAADSVLLRPDDGLSVEIHVVDNASPGNDAEHLVAASQRWGATVTLHLEKHNHGFGRGNNVVLRSLASRPDPPRYAYLLNPDARLVSNTVSTLAGFLDAHPRAAVAGSGILEEGTLIPASSGFRFPGLTSEFVDAVNFGPLTRLFNQASVRVSSASPIQEVDWVSGASMMARIDALAEVDFFDPDFFLYFEEVDLMRRLKAKGWQVWTLTDALIAHVAGASTGVNDTNPQRPPLPRYWFDSWRFYFEKQNGRSGARLIALARLIGTMIGDVIRALRRKPPIRPRSFVSDFWRYAVRPLFGAGTAPKTD